MKELFKITAVFALLTALIPTAALALPKKAETAAEYVQADTAAESIPQERTAADEPFFVLDFTTGQVMEMTMTEYVVGAVFGEMPASFSDEAIKAQAVAAHTYAVRRILSQLEDPDPELMGAYISNDSSKYQAYFSPEQAKYFYGDAYESHRLRITALVEEVIDEIIVWNGEPIIAAFHSSSGGMTESAENIWGTPVPYLVAVDSSYDEASPSFYTETVFSSAEVEARLTQEYSGIELPNDKNSWLTVNSVSPSGTVLSISAGNTELTGTQLRSVLNLRSACFDISYSSTSDSFTFSVKGSGHGVGLSQYGANAMAENGADYRQILTHYYKGAQLENIA